MYGIIVQKLLGESAPQQRIQPSATEIKTIRIDPRIVNKSQDPRMVNDPRRDPRAQQEKAPNLMNPDISDALKRLEQMGS